MGWGNCGTDSKGRPIGYVFPATCDHPGCDAQIDRGLSYACGGTHGEDEHSCEQYFCSTHRPVVIETEYDECISICQGCAGALIESGDWVEDDGELVLVDQEKSQ